MNSNLSPQ